MIDKRLLIDSVTVFLRAEKDEWGKKSYSEPIELSNIRFDRAIRVSGTEKTKSKTQSGTLFIYPKFTNVVVDDEWLDAKVTDDFGTYKIVGYRVNIHPFTKKVFSYEVEVI